MDYLKQNMQPLLIGAVVGAVLLFAVQYVMKMRETKKDGFTGVIHGSPNQNIGEVGGHVNATGVVIGLQQREGGI